MKARLLIADREVLLHGIYSRAGADLVITTPDGSTYVVRGFFILENPPELTDGADLHIPGQQAAAFAGPVTRDAYAGTPGALGTSVGQARQVDGTVTCTHPNGTTITLKVGDLIYMGDIITTEAGGHLGLVFVDGMSLALGENGDLVIDELVYNPATKGGRAAISLVSGAAEFVSGTIAHSGQDNMTFKTPVGTIGIRGTKVFVAYDPVSGDVSIINRPTGTDPQGNVTAGEIFLTLPNGTAIGSITSGNGGWQWNPTQGQAPQTVQLTEAQVQNVVATVEATVNNLATQAPPQPQAAPGTPAAAGGAAAGGQAGGDAAQGTQPAGQAGGDGGQAQGQGGDAGQAAAPAAAPAPGNTTQNTAPAPAATAPAPTTTASSSFGTASNSFGAPPPSVAAPPAASTAPPPVTPLPPVVLPPQQLQPSEFSVSVDNVAPVDKTATNVTFTITRTTNTTTPATVDFTTQGGTAVAGQDFSPVSGVLVFAAGETSKTVTVTILSNSRTELVENFSFVVTPDTSAIVPNGTVVITIPADPPLPTIAVATATVTMTDATAGNATITVTRTGDLTQASTVAFKTVAGTATAGKDFTDTSGTLTFATGEATKTITVPILADSTPPKFSTQELAETFTIIISDPTDATITAGSDTAVVTISADPVIGLANFTIDSATAKEGDTVTLVVHRAGDLVGQVSVDYNVPVGPRNASASGTLTFAAGEISKSIVVAITKDTVVRPVATINVTLSNPDGATIAQPTGVITIQADPIVVLTEISIAGGTVTDAVANTAIVVISLSQPATDTVTVNYTTSNGTAISGVDYIAASGTVTFEPGQTSKTVLISIPAQPSKTTTSVFNISLSSPSENASIVNGTTTVTILGNHINTAPTAIGAALAPTIVPGDINPSGGVITSIIGSRFVDVDGDAMSGIAIIANQTTTEGSWQYSSDNGLHWVNVESAPLAPPNTSPQVIATSSLLRFVPAAGFFGAAPPLIVAVMDNTYLGAFSNSATNTPVLLSSPTFGGISYLSSAFIPIQELIMITSAWDGGGSGDWSVATNWSSDVLPTSARVALINAATVTLQNNLQNDVGFLRLTGGASLTVAGGSTVLRPIIGALLDPGTTLSVSNGKVDADAALINAGTINIGQAGVSTGTFSGAAAITNTSGGVINANQGSITGLSNAGLFSVVDSSGLFSIQGLATNIFGGTLLIKGASANAQLTVAAPVAFQNTGTIQMTSVGAFEARLDITGSALRNAAGGLIQLDLGGGGQRIIAGDVLNLSGATIKVNTPHAVFQGTSFTNQGGTLNIAAGQQLMIASGSKFIHNGGTFVGSGVAPSPSAQPGFLGLADGAELTLTSSLTIPLGFVLGVGTFGGFGATVNGGGTLTVNGGVNMMSGLITAQVNIGSGGNFRATGDGEVALKNLTTVQSGGTLQLSSNNDDLYVSLSGTINNNGTTLLYAINSDQVTFQNAVFDFTPGTFNNGGTFSVTQVFNGNPSSGGTPYASGSRSLMGTMINNPGAIISIQTSTFYNGGTLQNYGSINISNPLNSPNGTIFGFGNGATFVYNSGTLTGFGSNGAGASILAFGPGSMLTVNGVMTIPIGLVLSLGSPEGGPTITGSGSIQISGGVMGVGNAVVSRPVTVNAGGSLSTSSNGLVTFSNITLNGDGTVANSGQLTLASGNNDVYISVTGAFNNSGGRINLNGGPIQHDITLDLSAGTFTNQTNGQFLITLSTATGQRTVMLPTASAFYNFGAIILSADTRFIVTSPSDLALSNFGTYTIQNSAVVDYLGTPLGNGLANQTGGTMTLNSGASLNLHHANLDNSGTLNNNGFIDMGGGNLTNNSGGVISGAGIIFMGGGTFINNGTSSITPGNSPGHMTIDGNAVFGAGTHTELQLAGLAAGQFDVLDVTKHFTMGGSLDVQAYDGFLPQAGDAFHVMNWGDATGAFDHATGLVMPNGIALDPVFDDHGLTLVARAITHQAGDGNATLLGTDQADVMVAGAGNDTLIANGGNDLMIGGSGNAIFVVGSGDDHIVGGSGTNVVDFSAQTSAVDVDLSAGQAIADAGGHHTILGVNDVIGSKFEDTIIGNAHDNVIAGGLGHDVLTGGAGDDTFVLNSPADGADKITDFASGNDTICLDAAAFGLDAGSCKVGENFSVIAGHFDGTNASSNAAFAAGQAALIYSAADHTLYFDSNGAPEGYTAVATLQPGAILSAADVKIVDHHALA